VPYPCDLLTLSRLTLLHDYGELIVRLNKTLIETNYANRKNRPPAELLRRSAVWAWAVARSLGFNDDPLERFPRRTSRRTYELGSKLYAPSKPMRGLHRMHKPLRGQGVLQFPEKVV
jgi:hypothetical protein